MYCFNHSSVLPNGYKPFPNNHLILAREEAKKKSLEALVFKQLLGCGARKPGESNVENEGKHFPFFLNCKPNTVEYSALKHYTVIRG